MSGVERGSTDALQAPAGACSRAWRGFELGLLHKMNRVDPDLFGQPC